MKDFDLDESDRKAYKNAKKRNRRLAEDMRGVLSTDSGKRVMWHILEIGGFNMRTPLVSAEHTQRLLGRRELVMDVHDMIMAASPVAFMEMLQSRCDNLTEMEEQENE